MIGSKVIKAYMVEYDKIAYSMNIVSLFLVTYEASCVFLDAFYAIKCIPMVNTYMWQGFGTNFFFVGVSGKLLKLECFLVRNLGGGEKRIVNCHTDFSLIYTDFIRWSCNCT